MTDTVTDDMSNDEFFNALDAVPVPDPEFDAAKADYQHDPFRLGDKTHVGKVTPVTDDNSNALQVSFGPGILGVDLTVNLSTVFTADIQDPETYAQVLRASLGTLYNSVSGLIQELAPAQAAAPAAQAQGQDGWVPGKSRFDPDGVKPYWFPIPELLSRDTLAAAGMQAAADLGLDTSLLEPFDNRDRYLAGQDASIDACMNIKYTDEAKKSIGVIKQLGKYVPVRVHVYRDGRIVCTPEKSYKEWAEKPALRPAAVGILFGDAPAPAPVQTPVQGLGYQVPPAQFGGGTFGGGFR